MTIISGPVKSIAYHSEVSEATAVCSASVIDIFEARRRLSPEYEGTAKEAEKEQGYRKAVCWLISLAALVSLLVGMFCLMESATLQPVNLFLPFEVYRVKAKLPLVKPSRRSVFDVSSRLAVSFPTGLLFAWH
jgi:hypothetical protein